MCSLISEPIKKTIKKHLKYGSSFRLRLGKAYKISKDIIVYLVVLLSIFMIIHCSVYIWNYYSNNHILWHYPSNQKSLKDPTPLTPNEIGDSIGGILNPLIGLTASVLTFLAFYMQKRANDEIQTQFKVQQFESQFYEMLSLHKENVNEMVLESKNKEDLRIEKRRVFKEIVTMFHDILKQNPPFTELTKPKFEAAYKLLFWGDSEKYRSILREDMEVVDEGKSDKLVELVKDHTGYADLLAHYFRHLFSMVKFVVESEVVIKEIDKMKYLKVLRVQLSNHEQILLFYNWLCLDYGSAWENNDNAFFTQYKMIHNIWYKDLYPDDFIATHINSLIDKYNIPEKTKALFEFQGLSKHSKIKIINETAKLIDPTNLHS